MRDADGALASARPEGDILQTLRLGDQDAVGTVVSPSWTRGGSGADLVAPSLMERVKIWPTKATADAS